MTRASWDDYFISMAVAASTRATCDRLHVGALIVVDRSVVATGYNGSTIGAPHCDDAGHLIEHDHCIRTVHAEVNAIAQAARRGARTEGATMYVTHLPCWPCFKLIVNAGIKKVIYAAPYKVDEEIFAAANAADVHLIAYYGSVPGCASASCSGDYMPIQDAISGAWCKVQNEQHHVDDRTTFYVSCAGDPGAGLNGQDAEVTLFLDPFDRDNVAQVSGALADAFAMLWGEPARRVRVVTDAETKARSDADPESVP